MTVDFSKQFRALQASGTDYESAIAVHQMRILERNVNILAHTLAPKLHFLFTPRVSSNDGTTDEHVIAVFAPVFVPSSYDAMTWTIQSKVVTSGTVRLALYSGPSMYIADSSGDILSSLTQHEKSYIDTTATSGWDRHTKELANISREASGTNGGNYEDHYGGKTWLILTAAAEDATYEVEVGVLDVTFKIKDAA